MLTRLAAAKMAAEEQVYIKKRSKRERTRENILVHRLRSRCCCSLRGGVKMSALQSVMSQQVISISCNCVTPAEESD